MPIELHCDGCARTLRVADTLAGKTVKCPHCQARKVVPGGEAAALALVAVRPAPAAPVPAAKPAARRPAPQPSSRARPADRAETTSLPWYLHLLAALPLGITLLVVYHGAVGSGPPWGGKAAFLWLTLALVSTSAVQVVGRNPTVATAVKVAVGVGVAVVDYLIVLAVLLANRP